VLGLILAGGGARGAYEAGVLRYVLERFRPRFRLVSGTSVGALTGAWVAAMGADGSAALESFWTGLRFGQVASFSLRDLLRKPFLRRQTATGEGVGVFDPSPLFEVARDRIPWDRLHARIDSGELAAFMVSATDVGSGRAHVFTDGRVRLRRAATSRAVATRIGPAHLVASAAIPFVFPAVTIDGRTYVDGALRQNTPLSPAVEAGVDRALVIGVKRLRSEEQTNIVQPTPGFLAGKALNALMLDPIEENLRRIDALNGLLVWAEGAYPGFGERCRAEYKPYQVVQSVFLRPSLDLGRLAAEIWHSSGSVLPWAVRRLLGAVAADEDQKEADLLSYLFFDRVFTAPLAELGFEDARRQEEEIGRLVGESGDRVS
jgi:NTE family protein